MSGGALDSCVVWLPWTNPANTNNSQGSNCPRKRRWQAKSLMLPAAVICLYKNPAKVTSKGLGFRSRGSLLTWAEIEKVLAEGCWPWGWFNNSLRALQSSWELPGQLWVASFQTWTSYQMKRDVNSSNKATGYPHSQVGPHVQLFSVEANEEAYACLLLKSIHTPHIKVQACLPTTVCCWSCMKPIQLTLHLSGLCSLWSNHL